MRYGRVTGLATLDVHLQPPSGIRDRHLSAKEFVQEVGTRLLLETVYAAIRDDQDEDGFLSRTGSMAVQVFDTWGIDTADMVCPDCGEHAKDGLIYARVPPGDDNPDATGSDAMLHCRGCHADWSVETETDSRGPSP